MRASVECGGNGLLQCSQVGRSSSIAIPRWLSGARRGPASTIRRLYEEHARELHRRVEQIPQQARDVDTRRGNAARMGRVDELQDDVREMAERGRPHDPWIEYLRRLPADAPRGEQE